MAFDRGCDTSHSHMLNHLLQFLVIALAQFSNENDVLKTISQNIKTKIVIFVQPRFDIRNH